MSAWLSEMITYLNLDYSLKGRGRLQLPADDFWYLCNVLGDNGCQESGVDC